jgi:hypothetical protein
MTSITSQYRLEVSTSSDPRKRSAPPSPTSTPTCARRHTAATARCCGHSMRRVDGRSVINSLRNSLPFLCRLPLQVRTHLDTEHPETGPDLPSRAPQPT